jgi:hypothetical protein
MPAAPQIALDGDPRSLGLGSIPGPGHPAQAGYPTEKGYAMPTRHIALAMLVIAWLIEQMEVARPDGHQLIEHSKSTYSVLNAAMQNG